MYTKLIEAIKNPPVAYETTGIAFWDDEHISKALSGLLSRFSNTEYKCTPAIRLLVRVKKSL